MNKLKLFAQTAAVVAVFSITPVAMAHDDGTDHPHDASTTSATTDDSMMMQTTMASDGTMSTQTMSDSDAMMQMQPAGSSNGVQTTATASEGNFNAASEAAPAVEPTSNRTMLWQIVAGFVAGLVLLTAALLLARRRRAHA